jgi:hypothetical protein
MHQSHLYLHRIHVRNRIVRFSGDDPRDLEQIVFFSKQGHPSSGGNEIFPASQSKYLLYPLHLRLSSVIFTTPRGCNYHLQFIIAVLVIKLAGSHWL